jgi:hypothetical protein
MKHGHLPLFTIFLLGLQVCLSAQTDVVTTVQAGALVAAAPLKTNTMAAPATPLEGEGGKFLLGMLAAGLGGFLAWIFKTSAGFHLTRRRLISYLLVAINSHLRQYKDLNPWLKTVMEKTIKKGHSVNQAARYTKDELGDLTEMRSQCLTYLNQNQLVQFTLLCRLMFELEALLDGFCKTLDDYKTKATVLTDDDVDYLKRKYNRILSYLKALPVDEVKDINKLPQDYSGIEGAEGIVTDSISTPPTPAVKTP